MLVSLSLSENRPHFSGTGAGLRALERCATGRRGNDLKDCRARRACSRLGGNVHRQARACLGRCLQQRSFQFGGRFKLSVEQNSGPAMLISHSASRFRSSPRSIEKVLDVPALLTSPSIRPNAASVPSTQGAPVLGLGAERLHQGFDPSRAKAQRATGLGEPAGDCRSDTAVGAGDKLTRGPAGRAWFNSFQNERARMPRDRRSAPRPWQDRMRDARPPGRDRSHDRKAPSPGSAHPCLQAVRSPEAGRA